MLPASPTLPLDGSERPPWPGFIEVDAEPSGTVHVVIKLRALDDAAPAAMEVGETWPLRRDVCAYAEVTARFGARQSDVDAVLRFARDYQLLKRYASAGARMVTLDGTVENVNRAFGIQLKIFRSSDGRDYRGYHGPLHVPASLLQAVTLIVGPDDRQLRLLDEVERPVRPVATARFTVPEIARLYRFPQNLRGFGQRIAVLGFGRRFSYAQLDFDRYFGDLGLQRPPVTAVEVGDFRPGTGGRPERGEITANIEIAGAVAPAAEVVAYLATFHEAGWVEAVTAAAHDRALPPTIIFTCFGDAEPAAGAPFFGTALLHELDRTFAEAALLGITVLAASGDLGASNTQNSGGSRCVIFPGSMPHVLTCGGTMLPYGGDGKLHETVWKEGPRRSGGGFSSVFGKPRWQRRSGVTAPPQANDAGRGMPDVAALAELGGYSIFIDGQYDASGGTSAATPLWAGLIALINEQLGILRRGTTAGFFSPLLYARIGRSRAFNDIVDGDNGDDHATSGWDPCTGWGTPHGVRLLRALTCDS
jgi:kumamolisin